MPGVKKKKRKFRCKKTASKKDLGKNTLCKKNSFVKKHICKKYTLG
jgi:hypothetical protein